VTIVEQGGVPAQAAPDLIKETTTQTFVKDVIEESKRQPVLIDFWAPWCGPCRQLTPIIEKAVRAAKGKVKLVKMNIDEHPAIPGQMGIQSIPAVIAFVNGQPADGFMGAVPESQVTAFIDKLTAGMPGAGELEQKVAANPLDHQARFDLATALNASGKRPEATHQLLEIVKRDRKWNEDGARKQLVQFFEAWGPTDEATVEGRKRLSTILFS
jgi:thioredoxin